MKPRTSTKFCDARAGRRLPDASILIVDDGSPDGTADIAEALAGELGPLEVLRRPEKSGLGSAYRQGFRTASPVATTHSIEMDSDLSHDPAALPSLLAPLDETPEIGLVVGSRLHPRWCDLPWRSWHRRARRWGNRYASLMLG